MSKVTRIRPRRQTSTDYSRPIMIHVCKDGTVTYRERTEPVFNGIALPVFSVDTPAQAKELIVRFCRRQYGEHPQMPGKVWYRLSRLPDGTDPSTRPDGVLELEDLEGLSAMFREFFDAHLSSARRSTPHTMTADEIDSKLRRVQLSYEDSSADRVSPTPLALSQHLARGWVVRINGDDVSICEIDDEFIVTVPYIEGDELLDQRPGCVRRTMGWDSVREIHIY